MPTVVQAATGATVANPTVQPVFGSAVTSGNEIIAFSFGPTANMAAFPTTSTGGWTRIGGFQDTGGGGFGMTVEIWSIAATGGMGTTPPQISNNYNSGRNYVTMWEITPGAQAVDQTAFGSVSASGGTSGTLTTGAASTLILGSCAADFNEFSTIATTGGWTIDISSGGPYGVHQAAPSSGTTVDMVIGASGFQTTVYGMVSLGAGGPPPPTVGTNISFWVF